MISCVEWLINKSSKACEEGKLTVKIKLLAIKALIIQIRSAIPMATTMMFYIGTN